MVHAIAYAIMYAIPMHEVCNTKYHRHALVYALMDAVVMPPGMPIGVPLHSLGPRMTSLCARRTTCNSGRGCQSQCAGVYSLSCHEHGCAYSQVCNRCIALVWLINATRRIRLDDAWRLLAGVKRSSHCERLKPRLKRRSKICSRKHQQGLDV